MILLSEIFNEQIFQIHLYVITAIIPIIIYFISAKLRCISKIEKRTEKLIAAMKLLGSHLDTFKDTNHPETHKSNFEKDMNIILDDDDDT